MTHVLLLIVCIASIEVFNKFKFFLILGSLVTVTKKVFHVVPLNKVSDHWKQKVIPIYALSLMKYSFQMLVIFLLVIFFFMVAVYFGNDFLTFTLSLIGMIESLVIVFGYVYLKKLFLK